MLSQLAQFKNSTSIDGQLARGIIGIVEKVKSGEILPNSAKRRIRNFTLTFTSGDFQNKDIIVQVAKNLAHKDTDLSSL